MKKRILIFALILALVMTAGIGTTMAYFTAVDRAEGGYPISLAKEDSITETFSNWTKQVSIVNKEKSSPVYVRVKAFAGSDYELTYEDESGLWTPGDDGYYYYSEPVAGGAATKVLNVHISLPDKQYATGDEFHVVVVYESTYALHDSNGNTYADWSLVLDTGSADAEEDE